MSSRMFRLWQTKRIKTVNPIHGCNFDCYGGKCWASQMAKRLQAMGVKGYEKGFEPAFCPRFLHRRYKKGDVVFVGSMGDLSWFPYEVHKQIVVELVIPNPEALFFFETKNPAIYHRLVPILPENVILSTTIETNRDYNVSKAPPPLKRYQDFLNVDWYWKHTSIEPIIKFDFETLVAWMKKLKAIISMGYDNYGVLKKLKIPEPTKQEYTQLRDTLRKFTDAEDKTFGR